MVQTFGKGDRKIRMSPGEDVQIELPSNPTTGFTWRADADKTMVSIREGVYRPGGGGIGAGGVQTFHVRSLKHGATRIRFEYVQPWEGQPAETCEFDVESVAK